MDEQDSKIRTAGEKRHMPESESEIQWNKGIKINIYINKNREYKWK